MSQIQVISQAAPPPPSGIVLQQVYNQSNSLVNNPGSGSMSQSAPTQATGVEIIRATITPKSASNFLWIEFTVVLESSAEDILIVALFKDSTDPAFNAWEEDVDNVNASPRSNIITGQCRILAGTTSATIIKLFMGNPNSNPMIANPISGGSQYTTLTISEIQA